ncbi:MAG: SDR family oxidoreductase [Candidatus Aminicenantales bacterium]|jgi:3-oxoacyl-[acyl-carrier protein] reductase
MIDPGLHGKVALITGANNPLGIGAATAKAFAAQGAAVFITSFRRPSIVSPSEMEQARKAGTGGPSFYEAVGQEPPEAIVRGIESRGGRAACHEADLADPSSVPRLFDLCEQDLGPADILVNNHAHWLPETFDPALVTDEGYGMRLADAGSIDTHYAVIVRASALLMAEYVKRYLGRGAKWGRIINVSTDAADSHLGAVSYAASKHAVESYSRSAAIELGKYGVTVNIVAPGPVQTGWLSPDEEDAIGRKTPLGRVGLPEDVADVVVFLASDQARWLTGQLIYIGGGWKMHQ